MRFVANLLCSTQQWDLLQVCCPMVMYTSVVWVSGVWLSEAFVTKGFFVSFLGAASSFSQDLKVSL